MKPVFDMESQLPIRELPINLHMWVHGVHPMFLGVREENFCAEDQ